MREAIEANQADDTPLQNRTFTDEGEFTAWYRCCDWLRAQGCSVGSLERGNPTGVIFEPGHYISKWRNLGPSKNDMHGTITGDAAGRVRNGPVTFTILPLGAKFLVARMAEEGMAAA